MVNLVNGNDYNEVTIRTRHETLSPVSGYNCVVFEA